MGENNVDKVKELAKYLEDTVLKDLGLSSDLEVQERASVMHQFLKYVNKHLEKNDDLKAADFEVFFAGELNPVAPKAQKKVPVPEGLDLDAWINEPPPSVEEESNSDDDADMHSTVFIDDNAQQYQSSTSSKKKKYIEPTP